MMKLSNTKLILILFLFVSIVYLIDFYILDVSNEQFWCVEVIKNFELGNFKNIRLPIHCDEGPYRFASSSLDNFFDKSNPYQGRPLFVATVGLFRFLIDLFPFSFSEYQNFKLSMFSVQYLVLFAIVKTFITLTNLDFNKKIDYLILFSLISIPSIRWNIFLSSVGNIPFLIFLLSLKFLNDKDSIKNKNNVFFIFGLFSLVHLSSIIYGLIILVISTLRNKNINFVELLQRILYLTIFQICYRLFVYLSDFTFYDWHKEVHNQFYWILDEFNNISPRHECQTFTTFLRCNFDITLSFVGYFIFLLIIFTSLFLFSKVHNLKIPKTVQNAFYLNLFVFIFWSFQGVYEPFRFVNYSIGYFLFFSVLIFNFVFKKDIYLVMSLIFFSYSIFYLEPYNSSLNSPQINFLTIVSLSLFVYFIFRHTRNNDKLYDFNSL